ncbi:hypothetical protein NsoK4_03115 [Nitrosopumilus sp. K4]|uniref:archaellin/type IV pilin N-terminal domain-containing protein n=1 Tax=Nitrosopumilus sp. K4 TaxID=2795383 RepID=UPI001BA8703E|nr:archaellin/type IV pilin N-terminal domain-containing protein [Nitrosopumilus sp. K4]QUC65258.1 hypothetical protein NsoK4_03115 [Nitrosopumilus sp. K4]
MTNIQSKERKLSSRRAVAPVIATLLLVAIAVVGGSIVFVFSQGFFSQAQVSGTPTIESLKFIGYDGRDGAQLTVHDGVTLAAMAGNATDGLNTGERLAIYVQNQGVQKATLSEVRFAGTVYDYIGSDTSLPALTAGRGDAADDGGFWILTQSSGTGGVLTQSTAAELQPGQQATIVLQLGENVKVGRDAQMKLTTSNGAVFVGTVVTGQQSG